MIFPPREPQDDGRDFTTMELWLLWILLAVCVVVMVVLYRETYP